MRLFIKKKKELIELIYEHEMAKRQGLKPVSLRSRRSRGKKENTVRVKPGTYYLQETNKS